MALIKSNFIIYAIILIFTIVCTTRGLMDRAACVSLPKSKPAPAGVNRISYDLKNANVCTLIDQTIATIESITYHDNDQFCTSLGTEWKLLMLKTKEKQDELTNAIGSATYEFWIGLKYDGTEWKWIDGTANDLNAPQTQPGPLPHPTFTCGLHKHDNGVSWIASNCDDSLAKFKICETPVDPKPTSSKENQSNQTPMVVWVAIGVDMYCVVYLIALGIYAFLYIRSERLEKSQASTPSTESKQVATDEKVEKKSDVERPKSNSK